MTHQLWCEQCQERVSYEVREEDFIIRVRNENFNIYGKRAFCLIHGEELFHTEFDKQNQQIAFNLYREKYKLVQPQEIKETREKYNLTQREYSYLLGFGEITISRYERGSLPTVAQNNIIKNSFEPTSFYSMLPNMHEKISHTRLHEIKSEIHSHENSSAFYIDQLHQNLKIELQYGLNILKFNDVVSQFAIRCSPYITKLNKLLFYTDFYHYKEYGYSLTGSRYIRYPYGPVPTHYSVLYELNPSVYRQETEYGEQILSNETIQQINSYLTEEEMKTIQVVLSKFNTFTSKQISDYSHEERAWKEVEEQEIIPYTFAKYLN